MVDLRLMLPAQLHIQPGEQLLGVEVIMLLFAVAAWVVGPVVIVSTDGHTDDLPHTPCPARSELLQVRIVRLHIDHDGGGVAQGDELRPLPVSRRDDRPGVVAGLLGLTTNQFLKEVSLHVVLVR